jgi:hypothetical protein
MTQKEEEKRSKKETAANCGFFF